MKKTLIYISISALTLTLASAASAGSGCGMNKSNIRDASHNKESYAEPRVQQVGYQGYEARYYYNDKPSKQQVDAKPDIVGVAASAGSFNTLIAAVKAAGLVDTLKGDGPYTVFAPTDEAFAKLPKGTLEALLADKAKLTQILTYHLVPGKVTASGVSGVSKLNTVEGSELSVADIQILKTDVMASNGVIHVIDQVLIPDA